MFILRTTKSAGRMIRPMFAPITDRVGKLARRILHSLSGEPARRRRRAAVLARGVLAEFHRLGFSRRAARGRRKTKWVRVRFEAPLLMTREELWAPIDLRRLPPGVTTNDLRDENVLRSIEDRLNTTVRIDYLANGKMCAVIKLGGLAFPETFPIGAVQLPPDAPPLAFPLGLDGTGVQRWADLARLPHLLVVGPTGKGKSTFIHSLLCTWVSRNQPGDIELWMADHKGGVELNRYRDLMSKPGKPGLVKRFSYKPEETVELLQLALKELERRLELLRQADASDVDDYGRMTGQRMARIAIVIDEIFFLMLNKEKIDPEPGKKAGGMTISQWAEHLFAKIASSGRAPGVHLVIATQRTGKDVLTGLITANFETRAVFGLADMYQSIYVLGNSSALGMPKGRIMWREEGGATSEIQTPLIKPDQTRLLLSRVVRYGADGGLGRNDEARRFRDDAKLLVKVACEEFEGRFANKVLFAHERVKGTVKQARVEEIARRLEKDGVLLPGGPRHARRVAAAFFGRPEMIDTLYGNGLTAENTAYEAASSSSHSQVVMKQEEYGVEISGLAQGHQEDVEDNSEGDDNTAGGLPESSDIAPTEDLKLPDPFAKLFEDLDNDPNS